MKILYFAALRERAGCAEEVVSPPSEVRDVSGLIAWLRASGPGHAAALADLTSVRFAVNHDCVDLAHPLSGNDEVAFFPPVTGG